MGPLALTAALLLVGAARPQPAPALPLRGLDGRPHTLSEVGGRVTVLSVWATYCEPCRLELPRLEALARRYAAAPDVRVVTAAVDPPEDRARVERMAASLHLTLPVYLVETDALLRFLRQARAGKVDAGIPMLLILGPGSRARVHVGFDPDEDFAAVWGRRIEAARRR